MTQAELQRARLRVRRIEWNLEDQLYGRGTYFRWHQRNRTRQAKARFEFVMLAALVCIAVCLELGVVGIKVG